MPELDICLEVRYGTDKDAEGKVALFADCDIIVNTPEGSVKQRGSLHVGFYSDQRGTPVHKVLKRLGTMVQDPSSKTHGSSSASVNSKTKTQRHSEGVMRGTRSRIEPANRTVHDKDVYQGAGEHKCKKVVDERTNRPRATVHDSDGSNKRQPFLFEAGWLFNHCSNAAYSWQPRLTNIANFFRNAEGKSSQPSVRDLLCTIMSSLFLCTQENNLTYWKAMCTRYYSLK